MSFDWKKFLGEEAYRPGKKLKIAMICIEIIQFLTAIGFFVYFNTMKMWPVKYMIYISVIMGIALAAAIVLKRWKWGCVVSIVLSAAMIILQCIGCYYIDITKKTLDKITTDADSSLNAVSVYVLKDNPAETIKDAKDYAFGMLSGMDEANTNAAIDLIQEELGQSIATTGYDNHLSLAAALYSGKIDAMILEEAYVDVISDFEGYETIQSDIRKIYTNVFTETDAAEKETVYEQYTERVKEERVIDVTKDTFQVYISGIDTEGSVTAKSRSDVNIILSVNPKTRQILMVSTPRDYYLPLSISNGVKDKLTHAGLYGVEVSMQTLEMLYDVDVDYYVRMNFTGFREIVDILGGIDVYSEYSFSAKGHSFQQGYNTLNGEAALIFARERHSFSTGDQQRGKNQMEVIKSVIDKVENSSLLDNYTSILDSISNCMQTNMSSDEISKLVKMQLDTKTPWKVSSYSVTGYGQSQYTYTVPGARAYVMEPNLSTVEKAKELFGKVAAGKKIKDAEKETN